MPVIIYLPGHFPVGSRCTHWPSKSCPCLVNASLRWRVFYSAPLGKKRNRCVLLQVKSLYIKLFGPPKVLGYSKIKLKNKHRSYLQFPELGQPVTSLQTKRTILNAASWKMKERRHIPFCSLSSTELLIGSLWVDIGFSVWPEELDGGQ